MCAACHLLLWTRECAGCTRTNQADLVFLNNSINKLSLHHHIKSVLCKYPFRIITAPPLPLPPSAVCGFSSRHASISPSPLLSYCLPAVLISTPLIFLPMNWSHWLYHSHCRLQPFLIYVPFFSLSLSLTLPFYCCIDRHVISYMNNASQETKIVALLPSRLGFVLQ